jgi:hypothetical protein
VLFAAASPGMIECSCSGVTIAVTR